MAESIRDRPAAEPPYRAVCEGIIDFGLRHRDMMALALATVGELEIPLDGRQRPLIDFEDTLAEFSEGALCRAGRGPDHARGIAGRRAAG